MGKTFKKYKGKSYKDKDSKNRKPSKRCLNHGGCSYCLSNRLHKYKRAVTDDVDLKNINTED